MVSIISDQQWAESVAGRLVGDHGFEPDEATDYVLSNQVQLLKLRKKGKTISKIAAFVACRDDRERTTCVDCGCGIALDKERCSRCHHFRG